MLDTPANILKKDYEFILRVKSGVNAWEEDLDYLHNSLRRDQKGCLSGIDKKQEKKQSKVARKVICSHKYDIKK